MLALSVVFLSAACAPTVEEDCEYTCEVEAHCDDEGKDIATCVSLCRTFVERSDTDVCEQRLHEYADCLRDMETCSSDECDEAQQQVAVACLVIVAPEF